MRFAAVAALCAAPLALAGALQAEIVPRGALDLRTAGSDSGKGSGDSGKKDNQGNYNGGSNVVNVIQADVSVTEIIIIWVNNGGGAATQTVGTTIATSGAAAAAATHTVMVGGSAGLVYTPDTLNAAVGDMVIFQFMSMNHTVTQSPFDTPCKKLDGGKDSGFMANPNNTVVPAPQMAMQVADTKPIWFYCRQKGHCGKGMVFSINPTANKTQAMFAQMAIAQNGTGAAAPIAGGSAAPPASSAPPAAAPPASSAAPPPPAASSGSMVSGSGTIGAGGQCSCSCLCGVAAFPSPAVQGIGGYGGMSGAMPMSALEA